MRHRIIIRIFSISSLLVGVTTASLPLQQATAQSPTPFLISPYFGEETVSQWFNPPQHNGIDFGTMDYERVLAAATGVVDSIW